MRDVLTITVTAVLVLAIGGCNLTGPSESLAGTWRASTGPSSLVEMTLQQTDDEVTGTACARSDDVLLYHGVPAAGEHPSVAFNVTAAYTQPCCVNLAGTQFSGKLEDNGEIVGRLGTIDVRFQRSTAGGCR